MRIVAFTTFSANIRKFLAHIGVEPQAPRITLDTSAADSGYLIEAQIPAQQLNGLDFKDGETLEMKLRKAQVFAAQPLA